MTPTPVTPTNPVVRPAGAKSLKFNPVRPAERTPQPGYSTSPAFAHNLDQRMKRTVEVAKGIPKGAQDITHARENGKWNVSWKNPAANALDAAEPSSVTPDKMGFREKASKYANQVAMSATTTSLATAEIANAMSDTNAALSGILNTGQAPVDAIGDISPANSAEQGPGGTMTIDDMQGTGVIENTIHNQEFLEGVIQESILPFSSPTDANYNVENLKSWLEREHLYTTFTQNDGTTNLVLLHDSVVLGKVAAGKLDYFRYFRGDITLTLRWNVPKTTFGAFILMAIYGHAPWTPGTITTNDAENIAHYKSFVDLQGSAASITLPWFYPLAYATLGDAWQVGGIYMVNGYAPPTTVTDFLPDINYSVYVSYSNITLMTPIPASVIPQGAVLSVLGGVAGLAGSAAAVASTVQSYQATGENVIRTFSEGLNLMRQEGVDPATPAARVVKPLVALSDEYAVEDYHQLLAIPTYFTIDTSSTPATFTPVNTHVWLAKLWPIHTLTRCDFRVKLHCIATPFHSGRLRIVYLPDSTVTLSSDLFDVAQGKSIIWDIQTDASIEFELPYGSVMEFNNYPQFAIFEEVPFVSPFASIIKPYIVAELTTYNMQALGYTMTTSLSQMVNYATWSYSKFPALPLVPQGLEDMGFYHPVHTSDDPFNTTIATTARRPGKFWFNDTTASWTGPQTFDPIGRIQAGHYKTDWYVGTILPYFAGWRGSIKVSFKLLSIAEGATNLISLKPSWAFGTWFTNGLSSSTGFAEIVLPYTTILNFYSVYYTAFSPYPSVSIDCDASASYEVYISGLDDFELLMPNPSLINSAPSPTFMVEEDVVSDQSTTDNSF